MGMLGEGRGEGVGLGVWSGGVGGKGASGLLYLFAVMCV